MKFISLFIGALYNIIEVKKRAVPKKKIALKIEIFATTIDNMQTCFLAQIASECKNVLQNRTCKQDLIIFCVKSGQELELRTITKPML
jgi:predicted ATP-dependent serine protease